MRFITAIDIYKGYPVRRDRVLGIGSGLVNMPITQLGSKDWSWHSLPEDPLVLLEPPSLNPVLGGLITGYGVIS